MPEPHAHLNALDAREAKAALARCCGARRWVTTMLASRPFPSTRALYDAAERAWWELDEEDHLEAFTHHPRLGENAAALRARFASTAALSAREQAGVAGASEATLRALRDENRDYAEKFGFVFLLCAAGKSADEMLQALRARMPHDRERELRVAAREHAKITQKRLSELGT